MESDIRHIRRIHRRLVPNLNRDSPHARPALRDQLRIPIRFALDASSEGRILDLHVCDDGAHVRAGEDVYARQGHRLLEKGKHVRHDVSGGAQRCLAGEVDGAVVGGMLHAQDISPGSEVDECSVEHT